MGAIFLELLDNLFDGEGRRRVPNGLHHQQFGIGDTSFFSSKQKSHPFAKIFYYYTSLRWNYCQDI